MRRRKFIQTISATVSALLGLNACSIKSASTTPNSLISTEFSSIGQVLEFAQKLVGPTTPITSDQLSELSKILGVSLSQVPSQYNGGRFNGLVFANDKSQSGVYLQIHYLKDVGPWILLGVSIIRVKEATVETRWLQFAKIPMMYLAIRSFQDGKPVGKKLTFSEPLSSGTLRISGLDPKSTRAKFYFGTEQEVRAADLQ